jgi:hypothetical protein
MRWSQETFKAEAHCTLFYNLDTKEWRPWAFPQEPAGMTVKLLEDDGDYKEQRKMFGNGWVMAGSIHHHCTAKAFQSGTDSADEKDKEGVHVTIGDVLNKTVDLHVRKVLNGEMMETKMEEFFEPPPWINSVPEQMRANIPMARAFGTYTDASFPEQWKTNIKERKYFTGANQPGFGQTTKFPGARTLVGGKESRFPTIEELIEQQKKRGKGSANKPKKQEIQKALDEYTTDVAANLGCTVKTVAHYWLHQGKSESEEIRMAGDFVHEAFKDIQVGEYDLTTRDIFDYMYALSK